MTKAQAKKKAKELRKKLNRWNDLYYNQDNPEVDDFTYDATLRELENLEQEFPELVEANSPSQRVGGNASSTFEKVGHTVQMMSLQDMFSHEEMADFLKKIFQEMPDAAFIVEPKIDGLSVSLEYTNGVLTRGSTRGDGFTGEDVTQNLMTIPDIPKQLQNAPEFLEVRGEVYMSRKQFQALVEEQELNGETPAKNPRNAAAGSLRQKKAEVTAKRGLNIWIFNIQQGTDLQPQTHFDSLSYLESLGFPSVIAHSKPVTKISDILAEIDRIGEERGDYAYDTDGVVVKINSFAQREELGATAKYPKWAAAFKFPPEEKETVLREIELSIGRTGAITPVAIFDPILLAGTMVSRATLHNQDFITERKIAVGDTILVRKAGEIIPEVLKSMTAHPDVPAFVLPTTCPICGAATIREESQAALYCSNPDCPAQLTKRLIHFVSRNAMNIDGLGPQNIQLLEEQKLIASAADLYILKKEQLLQLERFAEKSAENLIQSIANSKENQLDRLVYALGIPGVGAQVAKLICRKFPTMEQLKQATVEDLTAIDGIGEVLAQSVVKTLQESHMQELIQRLADAGCRMDYEVQAPKGNLFEGKTIVVTGTLQTMKRDEVKNLIVSNGGKAGSSVSGKTAFVVAGEAAGSKLQKAEELGIPVYTEEEFLAMLGES